MQDPYRPNAPGIDPELARLAQQGQQRRMQVLEAGQVGQHQSGDSNARIAVGAYRGSTVKRIVLTILIMGAVTGALGIGLLVLGYPEIGGPMMAGLGVAFVCIFLMAFIPPYASQGAMAAEQAWLVSLPFQTTGYFDVISAEPMFNRVVVFEIAWQGVAPPPDPGLLGSVFNAVDPQARLDFADGTRAQVTSGPISGRTNIRINNQPVVRNHRFPERIHAVVDRVLVTLHRSCPIAHVTMRSGRH